MVREDSHLQVLRCSVQEFRVCLFWAKVPLFCGWKDCLWEGVPVLWITGFYLILSVCIWVLWLGVFIEVKLFETLRCRLEYGSFMFGLKRLTFFLLRLIFSDAQLFMLKGNVLAVFVIRWTSSFVQRLQFPLVLVKIFASFFCYKASGVSFMFGIKRLLTCLFRISSVLCLCWVRTRYRRGRMPSWLGLEQVAVSVSLISLYQFNQYWDMFMLQVFVLRKDWFWFTLSCVWTVFTGALLILQDC